MMQSVVNEVFLDQLSRSPEFARIQRPQQRRLAKAQAYTAAGHDKVAKAEAKRARRRERNLRSAAA